MKQFYDNTMLASYKRCPREFYLRHIRYWRGSGTSMALAFGLCWHEAMDAVWTGLSQDMDTRVVLDAACAKFNAK